MLSQVRQQPEGSGAQSAVQPAQEVHNSAPAGPSSAGQTAYPPQATAGGSQAPMSMPQPSVPQAQHGAAATGPPASGTVQPAMGHEAQYLPGQAPVGGGYPQQEPNLPGYLPTQSASGM